MSSVSIVSSRNNFEVQVKESFNLIKAINNSKSGLKKQYKLTIVELAYLKIYLAWEQFLEETLLGYMMGGQSAKGYKVSSYVFPKNYSHALDIINQGRDYSIWTPDVVIRKANQFFKRHPYVRILNPLIRYLNEMKCVRNAIAHSSKTSREKFKTLVRSRIGYASYKVTPGHFLAKSPSVAAPTFFEYYTSFLINASKKIAP